MYSYKTKIKLHYTDAAGVLFFSNHFNLIHDAYESLCEHINFSFVRLIKDEQFYLPIVHAEADFPHPVYVGDEIDIRIRVERIGDTSFTLSYRLTNQDGTLVGTANTVHVSTSKSTREKILLPKELREALKPFS